MQIRERRGLRQGAIFGPSISSPDWKGGKPTVAVLRWPVSGRWYLGRHSFGNYTSAPAPFMHMWINFPARRGWVTNTAGDLVQLSDRQDITIEMRQSAGGGKFFGSFSFRGKTGRFEAALDDGYWLDVEFTGSLATKCRGEPLEIIGGDNKVAQMSQAERLNEAAHRALPKMPADVAVQLSGMLSVQSFGIMIGMFGAARARRGQETQPW